MTTRSAATLDAVAALQAELGERALAEMSLASFCTYRVGGNAAVLVAAQSVTDLAAVHRATAEGDVPVLVVGRGSNLLVADEGFDGVVVVLQGDFDDTTIDEPTIDGNTVDRNAIVTAGGAALLPVVARRTAKAGLTGFEWAVGVPGSIGGAMRMNAGGHGSDMAASVTSVSIFDLRTGTLSERSADSLELGYRTSSIQPHEVVVSATMQLARGDREAAEALISEIVRWRRANQPGGQNAGSVFANPAGDSAGRLIEAAGLKGHRLGSASVSDKHANFIQADPNGSANDVHALIHLIRRTINETDGIDLRPENRLVGFEGERHQ